MAQTVKLRRSASSGSVPTTSQLALGELAINTYDGKLYLKKNVSGTESIVEIGANNLADTFQVYEYSVTANTTVFQGSDDNSNTLSYTTGSPPRVAVYLNGLLLDWGTDFTATNGSSVTLTSAAVSGDLIQIQAYKSTVVAGSNLLFNDNIKAQFGNDGDLEIYHDGSNSYIADVGTGSLNVDTNGLGMSFRHTGSNPAKNMAQMTQYGVTLNYDGTTKLTTNAAGVAITGALTVSGDIIADDNNSTTDPTITFDGHTNSGFSIYNDGSSDYVNIISGGGRRAYFNTAGITSTANIYTASTSAFRNYGGVWAGTTGVANNGFYFLNTANSNTTKAMELSHDGHVIFPGEIRSNTRVKTDMITGIQQTGSFIDFDDDTTQGTNGLTVSSLSTLSLKFDTNNNDTHQFNIYGNGQSTAYLSVDNNGDLIALSGNLTFKEITGSDSYTQIKKTNAGSNLALVSQESIYMMLDGNNDQTNRSFQIKKNADAPGSGNAIFVVEENGNITSYGNMEVDTTNPQITFRPDDGILFRLRVDETANRFELGHSSNKNLYLSNTGSATFNYDLGVSGDLTVTGNLTVNGTQTVLNTATLSVDDLNITIADGAANAAAANGAGITVDGASATLTYTSAEDRWNFNKKLYVPDNIRIAAGGPSLILQDTTDDDDHTIRFMDNGGTNRMSITTFGDNLNFETTGSRNFTFKGDTSGAGQVLIGDSTSYHSAAQLQIVGGGSTTSATYARMLLKDADGSNQHAFIEETGGTFNITAQNGTSDGTIKFSQYNGTTTSTRMLIEPGGNVGINETNPTAKLHIVESSVNAGALYLEDGTTPTSWLRMVPNLGSGGYSGLSTSGDIGIIFSIDNDNTTDSSSNGLLIAPHTQTSGGLKILENGNVGIGVATPQESLHTTGNIRLGDSAPAELYTNSSELRLGVDRNNDNGTSNITFYTNNDEKVRIDATGNVGIGTDNPNTKLHVYDNVNRTSTKVQNNNHTAIFEAYGTASALDTDASNGIFLRISGSNKVHLDNNGNFGVNVVDPKAKFQVEEYGIDTTETSTSATTQTVIHTMSASDFRSARFTIQVTNSTDSTYHTTEILMVHDGTNANITEFGKVFTANEEATFDADVSSGNVRLLATPATTDSMEFKVVCHSITV